MERMDMPLVEIGVTKKFFWALLFSLLSTKRKSTFLFQFVCYPFLQKITLFPEKKLRNKFFLTGKIIRQGDILWRQRLIINLLDILPKKQCFD
jgi:hypothetical protein